MKCRFVAFPVLHFALVAALCARPVQADRAPIASVAQYPYLGAIVIDAATGGVLVENNADAPCYPASTVKIMDLLLIMEDVERGAVKLTDPITATAEAAGMGGTQVWLEAGETFTLDEMLFALMLPSANDAAVALAIARAGSKDAFVARMNARAQELGLKSTVFQSVHGLPPAGGQQPDISTARDLAYLGLELAKHPGALRYTSAKTNEFRVNAPEGKGRLKLQNHNKLLWDFPGCDGLKTGYIKAGGYCLVATAKRGEKRVVAAVVGSLGVNGTIDYGKSRDAAAAQLLTEGLVLASAAPPPPPPKPVVTNAPPAPPPVAKKSMHGAWSWGRIVMVVAGVALIVYGLFRRRGPRMDM